MARSRRTVGVVLGAVVVVGGVAFAGWWFVLRDDAPPEADIDTAGETLDRSAPGTGDASSGGGAGDAVDGTSEPVALPPGLADGERASASATGDLTIHGITNAVTIDLEAELRGDRAVVVGSAPVVLADYGIDPPTGFSVLSIADQGTFELQLFFTRG